MVLCDNLDGWDKGEGREAREEGVIYIYNYGLLALLNGRNTTLYKLKKKYLNEKEKIIMNFLYF